MKIIDNILKSTLYTIKCINCHSVIEYAENEVEVVHKQNGSGKYHIVTCPACKFTTNYYYNVYSFQLPK